MGRRQAMMEEREGAILVAAVEAIARDGIAHCQIQDIARDAHASTATIYKLFGDKEGLFRSAIRWWFGKFQGWGLDATEAADPIEGLRGLCVRYADMLTTPSMRGLLRAIIADPDGPTARYARTPSGRPLAEEAFAAILKRCQAEGRICAEDSHHAIALVMGMIEHQTLLHGLFVSHLGVARFSGAAVADEAVRALLAAYPPTPSA